VNAHAAAYVGRESALLPTNRLQAAMLVSFALHAFVLFGIGFEVVVPRVMENVSPPLEVILVNTQSQTRPQRASALAQVDLAGGGSSDADRSVKSPLPATKTASAEAEPHPEITEARLAARKERPEKQIKPRQSEAAEKKVAQLEQEARQLLTQLKGAPLVAASDTSPQEAEKSETVPDAATLVARSLAMARLEAEIAKDYEAYQKRPKRLQYDAANARKYVFARYVDDWRAKVERLGNLNYPEAARRQQLYGSLLLTVSVRHDGSVEKVELKRSSGQKLLDEAAKRIVHLASPFAAFAEEMRKEADILDITRTWTFTKDDELVSE
jgi:protein TonB